MSSIRMAKARLSAPFEPTILGTGGALTWCASRPRLAKTGPIVVGMLALANFWLLIAYELLILRHGVYGNLTTAWRYGLGLWGG